MRRELDSHPFADLIPEMTPEQHEQLVEDIGLHGLREPIMLYQGNILDGRHRYRALLELGENGHQIDPRFSEFTGTDEDAQAYVLSMNLHRRHLTYSQRAGLAAKWKRGLQEAGEVKAGRPPGNGAEIGTITGKAREIAAQKFQVGKTAVDEAEKVLAEAPDLFEVMVDGGIDLRDAQREVKKRHRMAEKTTIPAGLPIITERFRLFVGELEKVGGTVADESLDCIITDPPYPEEFLPCWDTLGAFAARTLKPGGSLLSLAPHHHLPDILPRLTPYLDYHWLLAYLQPGATAKIWGRQVIVGWKPILWFAKGHLARKDDMYYDVVQSGERDKAHHEWGQSVGGMVTLVERFTDPGETIGDPFVGGGATAVAAVSSSRLFVGIDSSPDAIERTKARLSEL